MQRILFTWELGANLGHLARQIPIAEEQRVLGRDVSFAVSNLETAKYLLEPKLFSYVLAPKIAYKQHRRVARNHADLLMNCGYSNPEGLHHAVVSWLRLLNNYKPDVLVVDHSPTVLLANKITRIPALQIGSGFEIPPQTFWPEYFPFTKRPTVEPNQTKAVLLSNMNKTIKINGGKEMQSTVELYEGCFQLLATFRELDHYLDRNQTDFIGPLYSLNVGLEVFWKSTKTKKVFVYVWPNLKAIQQLMLALAEIEVDVVAYIPQCPRDVFEMFNKGNIRVFTNTVDLKPLMGEADLLITHSGFATVSHFLLHGVPVMVVPDNLERLIIGKRIESLGVGLVMGLKRQRINFINNIRHLLDRAEFKVQASIFAEKYQSWHFEMPIKKITNVLNNHLISAN